MKTTQIKIKANADFDAALTPLAAAGADLLLVFGGVTFFESPKLFDAIKKQFPQTVIAGCSTAGEIAVDRVYDNSCVVTAVKFGAAQVRSSTTEIMGMQDSQDAGSRVAAGLPKEGLRAVLVFGTGVAINGSALVAGMEAVLPQEVAISGGLAADGGAFRQTWTISAEKSADNQIVAVGFYGEAVQLSYGTFAGWEPFGPARKVTRCDQNVLYELDGESALDIYKRYLGDYAKDLPGSGLLFPFEMLGEQQEKSGIFRTILGIDEAQGSLTLAGDIDPKGYLKLMHSSTDKLIEGAETAAKSAYERGNKSINGDALAILVSCIGRKLVMGDRVDEEIEAVADVLGKNTAVTGFYSNGEIAGSTFLGACHLHNQTMTISWISET
ncbi:FIST N-terminal domain-containing protein [Massilia sp. W12]|uniref:FIST signal transduction protein n=1 Tax=Massilia sp. W12 TaxID=3126507 RepID=UPI0030D2F1B1